MRSKIICSILSFLLSLYPSLAFGVGIENPIVPKNTSQRGKFYFLEKNDKAPFGGILLDNKSLAIILADKDFQVENTNLRLTQQKQKLELKHKEELELKASEYRIVKEECKETLDLKNKQIVEVEKIAIQEKTDWGWTITGTALGVAVGAVGGILIYREITK